MKGMQKIVMRCATALLCLTLISLYLLGGILARFSSSDGAGDGARVAAFILDLDDIEHQLPDICAVNEPGKSISYTFAVRNNRGDRISEVKGGLPPACIAARKSSTACGCNKRGGQCPCADTGRSDGRDIPGAGIFGCAERSAYLYDDGILAGR